jgi:hypothetical protein
MRKIMNINNKKFADRARISFQDVFIANQIGFAPNVFRVNFFYTKENAF